MRQIGTSPGGAGGFGPGGDALDGSGDRSGGRHGDRAGVGLRRDGGEGGRGGGPAGRDPEGRARAFQGRIDDARRRLARGADEDQHRDAGEATGAGVMPAALSFGGVFAIQDQGAGKGGSGAREPAADGAPEAGLPDGPDHARAALQEPPREAPTVLRGAEALGNAAPRRLLAAAEPPADALVALFAPPAPAAVAPGADGPASDLGPPAAVERRIADIADRVERAFQADLQAGPGAPIALRIPLDGAGDGLSSLTVTATAQGLDITLARAADGAVPLPELLAAAQALAERLQRRLGRGSVRVFDGVEASVTPRAAEGDWADLSAVLGRRTG